MKKNLAIGLTVTVLSLGISEVSATPCFQHPNGGTYCSERGVVVKTCDGYYSMLIRKNSNGVITDRAIAKYLPATKSHNWNPQPPAGCDLALDIVRFQSAAIAGQGGPYSASYSQATKTDTQVRQELAQIKAKQEASAKVARAKEEAEQNAKEAKFNATFPVYSKVQNSFEQYSAELKTLQDKKQYGVAIDENKLELLSFKIEALGELGKGYREIMDELVRLEDGVKKGVITTQEAESVQAKFLKEAEARELLYNRLLTLTTIPRHANSLKMNGLEWANYAPSANPLNSLMGGSTQQKNDNYYTDPKSPINILNNTSNTIEAGKGVMRQLKNLKF